MSQANPLSSFRSGASTPSRHRLSFSQWLMQAIGIPSLRVKVRRRGNALQVLCEDRPSPDASAILARLQHLLVHTPLEKLLPGETDTIQCITVYGRAIGNSKLLWAETIYLDGTQANSATSNTRDALPSQASGAIVLLSKLAQEGQPEAIAAYLSQTLEHLGVTVRVRIRKDDTTKDDTTTASDSDAESEPPQERRRLLVICESAYSPDPSLLAVPIAQRLRSLELVGFRDAIVLGQVGGELQSEWRLRVDLTPVEETLREWARWGDVQAIAGLLNRALQPSGMHVSALLKDTTLHLSCVAYGISSPSQAVVLEAVVPVLTAITPQGIHAATIYGLDSRRSEDPSEAVPAWIHWLDLPASQAADLASSTLQQAQAGHLEALTFLLSRLLNPDLEAKLATGGVRVQIRQKADLLHVMVDAPTCPRQDQAAIAIARFLKPLAIQTVAGVRIYGRQAGQRQPLWSYGCDFVGRSRLVPEATPEFAASDLYVGDLFAAGSAIVPWSEAQPGSADTPGKARAVNWVRSLRQFLVATQLFAPVEEAAVSLSIPRSPQPGYRQGAVALVWGAIGLLLVVQSDWLLGQWLQSAHAPSAPVADKAKAAETSTKAATELLSEYFPQTSLQKTNVGKDPIFTTPGFTQPGEISVLPNPSTEMTVDSALPASPLQPRAIDVGLDNAQYPSFNSRQLDIQLALYRRYLHQYGSPPDVLIVGSSRALRGVDPLALQQVLTEQGYPNARVFNLGINGATAQVVDLLIRQLLPPDQLPRLILWADGARAFNSGRLDITYNGIVASKGYKAMLAGTLPIPTALTTRRVVVEPNAAAEPGGDRSPLPSATTHYQQLDERLSQYLGMVSFAFSQRDALKDTLRETLAAKLPKTAAPTLLPQATLSQDLLNSSSPPATAAVPSTLAEGVSILSRIDIAGFLPLSLQFNPATYYQKYTRVMGEYDFDYESFVLDGKQTNALISIVGYTQSLDIPLVFVNLPLTDDYLDPTRQRHEAEFQQGMLMLATQLGFTYRNLQPTLKDNLNYFSDPSHLNRYGAYEVSRQLADDVMIPWSRLRSAPTSQSLSESSGK